MRSVKKTSFWIPVLVAVIVLALLVVAAGCGTDETTTTTEKEGTATAAAGGEGKLYVAVTGAGELEAGGGNMGIAEVDLGSKEVKMINVADSAAPHGIIFTGDTKTAPNTRGRTATEEAKQVYLGNAQGGTVLVVNLDDGTTMETIQPPAGAPLAVCGMQMGTDGTIWISSMGDGKVYPLDPMTNTIGAAGPGGGDITSSICGISWSQDNMYAYLNNMSADPGYIAKITWPAGELVSKIENITKPNPGLTVHQDEVTPDGKYLYATGGADDTMIKIDMETDNIVKTIPVGAETHSIVFTPDGKTAYIAVRHYPTEDQCGIFVYDVEKDEVIDRIPGIQAPLICGLILQTVS